MKGKAIITNGRGWACSNEATTDTIDTPIRGLDGKITSVQRRMVMTIKDAYTVSGELSKDDDIDAAIMTDNKRISFRGRINKVNEKRIEIALHTVCGSDHTNELISKIKQIGGH